MGGERNETLSRRGVLAAAAAAGTLGGIGGLAAGQAVDVELEARVGGWVGRAPRSIAGATNPTLSFESGRTYRVTWTNGDGIPHNFAVESADGDRLVRSETVSGQGASRTVEFEATPAMAEYYCEVHPQTMRGTVAVGSSAGTTAAETETGTGTGTETETATETTAEAGPPPVLDEATVVLGGQAGYWLGLAPSGIQGRPNPTLRLRAGREYELVWVNLDGVEHDFHVVDANGEDLADTSGRDDVGETRETSFEATPAMAEYLCAFHPQSMRGGVEVVTDEGLIRR